MKELYKASLPGEEPKHETPYCNFETAKQVMKAQLRNTDPEFPRVWLIPVLAEPKNGEVIDFKTREKIG